MGLFFAMGEYPIIDELGPTIKTDLNLIRAIRFINTSSCSKSKYIPLLYHRQFENNIFPIFFWWHTVGPNNKRSTNKLIQKLRKLIGQTYTLHCVVTYTKDLSCSYGTPSPRITQFPLARTQFRNFWLMYV